MTTQECTKASLHAYRNSFTTIILAEVMKMWAWPWCVANVWVRGHVTYHHGTTSYTSCLTQCHVTTWDVQLENIDDSTWNHVWKLCMQYCATNIFWCNTACMDYTNLHYLPTTKHLLSIFTTRRYIIFRHHRESNETPSKLYDVFDIATH